MKRGFLLVSLFLVLSLFMIMFVSSGICPDGSIGTKYYDGIGRGDGDTAPEEDRCECDDDAWDDECDSSKIPTEIMGTICYDMIAEEQDTYKFEVVACVAPSCSDGDVDANNPYLVQSSVENAYGRLSSDTCVNENTLKEYYCNTDLVVYEDYNCLTELGPRYGCLSGKCELLPIVPETTCSDSDGGVNYFTGGNTTLDDDVTFQEDFCVNGNTLTEFSCSADGESIIDQTFDCNCLEDGDGFGYCDLGDGLVCEAADTSADPAINDSLDADAALMPALKLPKNPVGSRSNNLDSSITDSNSYYCGLDLNWHITKPTLLNLGCVDGISFLACGGDLNADGSTDSDDDFNGDDSRKQDGSVLITSEDLGTTACAQDYECQINSCLDGYCISIGSELKAQRGILIQMWCAIVTLPTFVAGDREGMGGPFDDCMLNSFPSG